MITQSPQVKSIASTISWVGDIYQINGEEYDFSPLLDGEKLPFGSTDCSAIVSVVERIGAELYFTYIRGYIEDENTTHSDRFPEPLDNTGDSV